MAGSENPIVGPPKRLKHLQWPGGGKGVIVRTPELFSFAHDARAVRSVSTGMIREEYPLTLPLDGAPVLESSTTTQWHFVVTLY